MRTARDITIVSGPPTCTQNPGHGLASLDLTVKDHIVRTKSTDSYRGMKAEIPPRP